MNSLDIQKWRNKYIYQINESEGGDFNITLGPEWEYEEIFVGDIITPDMWKDPEWNYYTKKGNIKVKDIGFDDFDDFEYIILSDVENEENWQEYDLNYVNSMLQPPYKIIKPINESDEEDDFNITTDAFDVTELKKGDIIYRDMWKDPEWSYFTKMGNVEIADVGRDDYDFVILADSEEGENWEEYDLNYVNSMLEHPYKIVLN